MGKTETSPFGVDTHQFLLKQTVLFRDAMHITVGGNPRRSRKTAPTERTTCFIDDFHARVATACNYPEPPSRHPPSEELKPVPRFFNLLTIYCERLDTTPASLAFLTPTYT